MMLMHKGYCWIVTKWRGSLLHFRRGRAFKEGILLLWWLLFPSLVPCWVMGHSSLHLDSCSSVESNHTFNSIRHMWLSKKLSRTVTSCRWPCTPVPKPKNVFLKKSLVILQCEYRTMSSGLWDLLLQCLCGNVGILCCLLECGYHLTGLMCAEHQTWKKRGNSIFATASNRVV